MPRISRVAHRTIVAYVSSDPSLVGLLLCRCLHPQYIHPLQPTCYNTTPSPLCIQPHREATTPASSFCNRVMRRQLVQTKVCISSNDDLGKVAPQMLHVVALAKVALQQGDATTAAAKQGLQLSGAMVVPCSSTDATTQCTMTTTMNNSRCCNAALGGDGGAVQHDGRCNAVHDDDDGCRNTVRGGGGVTAL